MDEKNNIIIRRFVPDDFEDFFEMEGSEEVMRFTGPGRAQTRQESLDRFHRIFLAHTARFEELGFFAVESNQRKVIGFIMVYERDEKPPELGFMLNKDFWGKGIAKLAVFEVVDRVRINNNCKLLTACVETSNVASLNIIESLGFDLVNKSNESKNGKDFILNHYELTL